jgi:predicted Zn-dependent protease with MMP-like domain
MALLISGCGGSLAMAGQDQAGGTNRDFGSFAFAGPLAAYGATTAVDVTQNGGVVGNLETRFFGPDAEEIAGPFYINAGSVGAQVGISGVTAAKRQPPFASGGGGTISSRMPDPDMATFEHLARKAMAALPLPFREYLDGIRVCVEEYADRETLDALDINDPSDLTGLYHGRPLSEQSIWVSGELPPVICLYRQPLLREWRETAVRLEDLVRHVVIHEVGHHFGLSDEEMEAIEDAA